ncbi:MAG: hypothetical protein NDJ90_09985 [Oligoflexia bacterium]|nr:hypothetical protein [Oligoflexia bacterium]
MSDTIPSPQQRVRTVALGLALLTLASGFSSVARAEPFRDLYRGARATAMGNAFVGLADDEQALFLNPAGLAGVTRHSINYFAADVELSRDVIGDIQSLGGISDPSGVNAIMGKKVLGRFQFSPSFLMPNVGVGLLVDQQFAILAKNRALPKIVLGYQATNGIQAAYGVSLLGKSRRRKSDLRFGVGGKVLWRRGGYRQVGLTQMLNLNEDELRAMMGSYGMGYGFDAGLQSVTELNSRLTMSAGLVMTEIGDIKFRRGGDKQEGNFSAGLAFKYRLPQIGIAMAYDYRHILETADWRKKVHFGTELTLPMLGLYFGLNQLTLSYGVAFDAWLFKVTAVSYSEELGSVFGQERERRFLLRTSLRFGL